MDLQDMKKSWAAVLAALLLSAFLLGGCEDDWDEEYQESETEEGVGTPGKEKSGKDDSGIEPVSVGSDARSATVMIYMNGSDLESEAGEATADIAEMIGSGIGEKVNVLIQTMGTKRWQDYGISSKTSQIYEIRDGELKLLQDDLGQLDCTVSKTLSDFIGYGKEHFPADRYMLLLWDHGGGPVYGFGYDEWQSEEASLTLDEMRDALSEHSDIRFDLIGMDCCIMANVETCYILAPFCKYAVLSEDFESGMGWSYEDWMRSLEKDPGISTPLLGKKIIDASIKANEEDYEAGDSATMIMVNERAVPELLNKWVEYAYQNSEQLLGENYSRLHKARGRGFFEDAFDYWEDDGSDVTMRDYYVSDMLSIVESVGKEGETTDNLRSALKACVAYFGHTSDKNELTGLSVSLPYGDPEFYAKLEKVYSRCGFDSGYIDWLKNFVDAEGSGSYYDYSEFEDSWGGWECYEEGWGSCGGEEASGDWEYDYEEELWYLYEDGGVYLYDDETGETYFYDEESDEYYYYDEYDDEWYIAE